MTSYLLTELAIDLHQERYAAAAGPPEPCQQCGGTHGTLMVFGTGPFRWLHRTCFFDQLRAAAKGGETTGETTGETQK